MSKELKRLKIANYFVWASLAIWILLWIVWFIPRQTVEVTDFRTTQESYRVGEELVVTSKGATYFDGQSTYDIRLNCDGGRYLLKSFTVTTKPSELKHSQTSVGVVPVIPTPDWCVVRTQATHTVQILPFIKKTYTNQWETNRFLVEAEKG